MSDTNPALKSGTKLPKSGSLAASTKTTKRLNVRLDPNTEMQVKHWVEVRGFSSMNDYIVDAVQNQIARESGDFDVPNIAIQRLNQVIDELKALSVNVANLERVVITGNETMIGLTRGDNYLLDDEDGELGE